MLDNTMEGTIAEKMEASTQNQANQNNGPTFKAIVQQASPVQNVHSSNTPTNTYRKGSLPVLHEDLLRPTLPGTSSDPASRTHSSPETRPLSDGEETSPRRRSVQFARETMDSPIEQSPESPTGFTELLKDRRGISLISKLKALATTGGSNGHVRSPSGHTVGGDSIDRSYDLFTPDSEIRSGPQSPDYITPHESDADSERSDAEDSTAGASAVPRRRKSRRPQNGGTQTAPVTPKIGPENDRPHLFSWHSSASGGERRRRFLRRRATMDDIRNEQDGISENEGRQQSVDDGIRHRGAEMFRGMSYNRLKAAHNRSTSENVRPGTFRRALTNIRDRADGEPSPWRARGDRTASLGAARWRQIRAGFKLIGRQRKAQVTIDHAKSAELLAELSAGTPAALMLASMFLRDEHGNRRVPILLEQVKVKVLDGREDPEPGGRQTWFRIELEYGNGLTRMKWVINRSFTDFANLHARLRAQRLAQKVRVYKKDDPRSKIPKFPKSSFPWLRGLSGTGVSDSEGEEEGTVTAEEQEGGNTSGVDRPVPKTGRSFRDLRRKLSVPGTPGVADESTGLSPEARKERQMLKARESLEVYLQKIIRYVMFRPESNRLCRFLEISALGVRLAAEDSYHGKEGYLRLITGSGIDFRRNSFHLPTFKSRHDAKWFLVRHSYIVCVDSPEAMNIYDVLLLDSDFKLEMKKDQSNRSKAKSKVIRHHVLKIANSEREVRLLVQHERQLEQWYSSINEIIDKSPWSKKNRFDSFAPVRQNVFAQWLVDGRDYMWNVSRAISMAKDVIYIHDWWLSPEVYMRRPACISQKWRLDRLLQKKAKEGVKIFVIVYRNINSAIPIDSGYTKFSLLDLDSNIFVQRSPNQLRQSTFFWAHHEKICIIDHMVAFVGGIDLCFGRWDTPAHELADDKLTGFEDTDVARNTDNCQMWPGKDYSNPRVQDFYGLDKPYEEMYDRSRTPRMPWHDIHMQVVGQPARDLTRHFIQRWNYILRQRKPSRPTPFLLPPPELKQEDIDALGLNGTCEVQMLRSCGEWSLGTPKRIEHSIMTAYVSAVQQSEHFVYIENQFFISTCEMESTRIENLIGDALVERIIRAEDNNENWRAVIVIPLIPGFQNTVDSADGTSIRLIMQCQYRSICRGDSSIFGRLQAAGIKPEKYIKFFSLRKWGKIGPNKVLTTEQLYIHAKCMVVDDRVAIIGSANINERSMLGDRDSECAAVVRDTDRIWSTMGGQPYLVGRFPHSLRIRLMREHLGIDVDADLPEPHLHQASTEDVETGLDEMIEPEMSSARHSKQNLHEKKQRQKEARARTETLRSFNAVASEEQANNPHMKSGKRLTKDARVMGNEEHKRDVEGHGIDRMHDISSNTTRARAVSVAASHNTAATTNSIGKVQNEEDNGKGYDGLPPAQFVRKSTVEAGLLQVSQLPAVPQTNDIDIGGPPVQLPLDEAVQGHPLLANMKRPEVDENCMRDPLTFGFYHEIWDRVAQNNTAIFRAVFRCQPDDEVKRWADYKDYAAYSERFNQSQGGGRSKMASAQSRPGTSGPPGAAPTSELQELSDATRTNSRIPGDLHEKVKDKIIPMTSKAEDHIEGTVEDWAADAAAENAKRGLQQREKNGLLDEKAALIPQSSTESTTYLTVNGAPGLSNTDTTPQSTRTRKGTASAGKRDFRASDDVLSKEEAENMLQHVQGNLIIWPYEWLAREEQGGRWLFSIDQLAPLEIYN